MIFAIHWNTFSISCLNSNAFLVTADPSSEVRYDLSHALEILLAVSNKDEISFSSFGIKKSTRPSLPSWTLTTLYQPEKLHSTEWKMILNDKLRRVLKEDVAYFKVILAFPGVIEEKCYGVQDGNSSRPVRRCSRKHPLTFAFAPCVATRVCVLSLVIGSLQQRSKHVQMTFLQTLTSIFSFPLHSDLVNR